MGIYLEDTFPKHLQHQADGAAQAFDGHGGPEHVGVHVGTGIVQGCGEVVATELADLRPKQALFGARVERGGEAHLDSGPARHV
jgi:hypothetical protein